MLNKFMKGVVELIEVSIVMFDCRLVEVLLMVWCSDSVIYLLIGR